MSKFYKTPKNIITVLDDGADLSISCCGQELEELIPNTSDGAGEKHVPVVTVDGNTVTVSVGEVEHPMLDEHYISEIVLDTNKGAHQIKLNPAEKPQAVFVLEEGEVPVAAYEYCNLHGLWKKDI